MAQRKHPQQSLLSTQQRRQVIGAPIDIRFAARGLEAIQPATGARANLVDDDITFLINGDLHCATPLHVERVAYLFGDGDLAFAIDGANQKAFRLACLSVHRNPH